MMARASAFIPLILALAAPGVGAAATNAPAAARIFPDYDGVTVPPNIAPLNFQVKEPGKAYRVTMRSRAGQPIAIAARDPGIRIPARPWRELLAQNPGQSLVTEIAVQTAGGAWQSFLPITNQISADPVDGYLVYRQLKPLYNLYANVGIYQRDLAGYRQTEVLENRRFNHGCLNCHTFLQNSPSNMFFHTRGVPNNPMILVQGQEVTQVAKTAGYASWHPSGRLVAYSVNKLSVFYHTRGPTRDVFDADSDLQILHLGSNVVEAPPAIAITNRLETWPAWAPDGRHLYFCSAEQLPQDRFREVRYDLMRVSFDPAQNRWGAPETLVSAETTGLSAAQPKISPDGRWLVFSLFKYGNFPIYHPNADLYLLDLQSRAVRKLEINSDQADSWHCWSSNGRWMVFNSKRRDGVFTHPYFTHVDGQGRFTKPFLLPQEDPLFYDTFIKNFNVPELIQTPVTVPPADLARAILAPKRKIQPVPDALHPPKGKQGEKNAAQ